MDPQDLNRLHMIPKRELLKRRQEERTRAQLEMMENCDNGNFSPAISVLGCCCIAEAGGCFEENPCKKKASGASVSGMFYGGIVTGGGAARSWPFCLGIGISAIVLGALTATGLCVDECYCSNSAERNSNPVEAQPEGTLGSAVTIHQLH